MTSVRKESILDLSFVNKMTYLSTNQTKAYNLLCIGQRSVGKTVFLGGSYTECNAAYQAKAPHQLWFECQDSQDREKIESILNYVAHNRKYPPATMKITNFNFSLKRRGRQDTQTLCHFRWWDVPGEICNIHHPDFQKLVLVSHGCCVFIDAEALVSNSAYLQVLEDMIKQVVAIASLANQYGLRYAFALIFTKCDLLGNEPLRLLQIEEKVQPLIARLDAVKADYQRFYSAIPIVFHQGTATLKGTGAAAPLLWLVSELRKIHKLHTELELGIGLMQSQAKLTEAAAAGKNSLSLDLPLIPRGNRLSQVTLSICLCLLGASISLFFVSVFGPLTLATKQAQTSEKKPTEQIQCPDKSRIVC